MVDQDIPYPLGSTGTGVTFVSHASKDKRFVKGFVDALIRYGVKVWYDEYEITVGDDILVKINSGLTAANYGVVVFSPAFLDRTWTQMELSSLVARLKQGQLLPVVYKMTVEEVLDRQPLFAGIRMIPVPDDDVQVVVSPIARKILGEPPKGDDGRPVYKRLTVSIRDIPKNAYEQIENVVFEECTIQGPAVLTPVGFVEFPGCLFTKREMFITFPPNSGYIGTIGLVNVTFKDCRFKVVGFTSTTKEKRKWLDEGRVVPRDYEWPIHLR